MTRYLRVTPSKPEQVIDWHRIEDVRFLSEHGNPYFVLDYKGGGGHTISPADAQDLYYKVRELKGCQRDVCFHRHNCDEAPAGCTTCKIAEHLEGMGIRARPDPVPPVLEVKPGIGVCVGAGCVLWVLAFVAACAITSYRSPTLPEGGSHAIKRGVLTPMRLKRGGDFR